MNHKSQDIKTLLSSLNYPQDLLDEIRNECIFVESGHLTYWPTPSRQGYLDEYHLLAIAKVLNDVNAPWDEQLEREFLADE